MEFWDQNDSGICRVSEKLEWWNLCVNWRPVRWVDVVWGYLKWKLNPQDAISRERKTWPGRLRRNGQHLLQQHRLGTPGDGSCISRRPRLTRSLEDARYVHINFRLLADLVVFEQVKKYVRLIFFFYYRSVYISVMNLLKPSGRTRPFERQLFSFAHTEPWAFTSTIRVFKLAGIISFLMRHWLSGLSDGNKLWSVRDELNVAIYYNLDWFQSSEV